MAQNTTAIQRGAGIAQLQLQQTADRPLYIHAPNRAQRRAAAKRRASKPATRPKYRANPLALFDRVLWSRPFDPGEPIDMQIRARQALTDLMSGTAPFSQFEYLAMVLNITLVRAEEIGAQPLLDILTPGMDAMTRARLRYSAGKGLNLDADGRRTVPDALELYEQILENSSPMQMEIAARTAYRRCTGRALRGDR